MQKLHTRKSILFRKRYRNNRNKIFHIQSLNRIQIKFSTIILNFRNKINNNFQIFCSLPFNHLLSKALENMRTITSTNCTSLFHQLSSIVIFIFVTINMISLHECTSAVNFRQQSQQIEYYCYSVSLLLHNVPLIFFKICNCSWNCSNIKFLMFKKISMFKLS